MSFPFRLVARSKAARVVSVGVLGVTLGVPAADASPAPERPGFVAQSACSGSTVTREYTAEAMTFRLHLDLDGCRWWDGSARNLNCRRHHCSRDHSGSQPPKAQAQASPNSATGGSASATSGSARVRMAWPDLLQEQLRHQCL